MQVCSVFFENTRAQNLLHALKIIFDGDEHILLAPCHAPHAHRNIPVAESHPGAVRTGGSGSAESRHRNYPKSATPEDHPLANTVLMLSPFRQFVILDGRSVLLA